METMDTERIRDTEKVSEIYDHLLAVALFLSYLGVGLCVRNRLTRSVIDKYQFMTERMGLSLDNLYQKSDEMTAECNSVRRRTAKP